MASLPGTSFWTRMTPRERTYILVLLLTFFVMGTVLLLYERGQVLGDKRDEIETYRVAMSEIHTRGAVYEERIKAKQQRESSIASEGLLFSTLLEEAQRGIEGIVVEDQEEKPLIELGGGLVKRTFEFRLRGVKFEDAVKFLTALETQGDRVILTEELSLKSPSSAENRLNIDVAISTWERRDQEPKAADAAGEEP